MLDPLYLFRRTFAGTVPWLYLGTFLICSPYIQSISSLFTKAILKTKSSGIGKSGRKVSRYECFFKEIIYKNKSKGADTIIFKMFQNSNRQHFQQVVRQTLVVHGPLKTESLSILSLGFC